MTQDVTVKLNYLAKGQEKPVIRVGDYGRPSNYEADYEWQDVTIRDARQLTLSPRLDENGFELLAHETALTDFADEAAIQDIYYPETAELMKKVTGASDILIFDHTLRLEQEDGQSRSPVRHVHNDYTARSAKQRVRDLLSGEKATSRLNRRFVQLNAWRPIGAPVLTTPLALTDAQTVAAEDLVATDLVYPDRVGEIYEVTHNPAHRLYYYPRMRPDELLLIKGSDSDEGDKASFTPHSAFDLEVNGNPPPRQSIELRALAFY